MMLSNIKGSLIFFVFCVITTEKKDTSIIKNVVSRLRKTPARLYDYIFFSYTDQM
jgi:hypothetical protein